MIPLKINNFKNNPVLIGLTNSFSGGIFLSMGFLHLLPEANEAFDDYFQKKEKTHSFPFSYLLAVLGYSFILLVEKIIFDHHEHDKGEVKEQEIKELYEVSELDFRACSLNMELKPESINLTGSDKNLPINYPLSYQTEKKGILKPHLPFKPPSENNDVRKLTMTKMHTNHEIKINLENRIEKKERKFKKLFSTVGRMSDLVRTKLTKNKTISPKTEKLILENNSIIINQDIQGNQNPPISSYLLILALSIHAVFEGIALGLQDTKGSILEMLIAIMFHKWVEVISISLNLSKSNVERGNIIKLIMLFSLMTPCGTILGLLFSGFSILISAIFLSISAGTFVYISASEIIIEEFSVSQHKKRKFVAYLCGIVIICFLLMFEGH